MSNSHQKSNYKDYVDIDEDELERKLDEIRRKKADLSKTEVNSASRTQNDNKSSQRYDPGDIIKQEYRFIRSEQDDEDAKDSWEKQVAKSYHEKLFKEFALADLTRSKEGKIGLRWRVAKEVRSGKGHTICGNKACPNKTGLTSYEVPFRYIEAGENKIVLVKLRVCEECSVLLQWKTKHKQIKEEDIDESNLNSNTLENDNIDPMGAMETIFDQKKRKRIEEEFAQGSSKKQKIN